jgi:hypothetical protein
MHLEGSPAQTAELIKALIEAQAEFPPIPRTKTAYNYKYAPLDKIHEIIRPILAKHGLAVVHPIVRVDGKQTITTTILHAGGGRMSCDGLTVLDNIKMQEQGGQITYGSRYGYCSMLGISSEDDDENRLAAARSPRRQSRQDGVAQDGRAPVPAPPPGPTGDSSSIPDPSLPSLSHRKHYAERLKNYLSSGLTAEALQAYVLRESGATESRFIKTSQWLEILAKLDDANAANTLDKLVAPKEPA